MISVAARQRKHFFGELFWLNFIAIKTPSTWWRIRAVKAFDTHRFISSGSRLDVATGLSTLLVLLFLLSLIFYFLKNLFDLLISHWLSGHYCLGISYFLRTNLASVYSWSGGTGILNVIHQYLTFSYWFGVKCWKVFNKLLIWIIRSETRRAELRWIKLLITSFQRNIRCSSNWCIPFGKERHVSTSWTVLLLEQVQLAHFQSCKRSLALSSAL